MKGVYEFSEAREVHSVQFLASPSKMDIQQPSMNLGYSPGQNNFCDSQHQTYESYSEECTEAPETVSFPEHFCFSGSNNSSEEEISLQWNRIEP
jgi:hypothetical protein